MLLTLRNTNSQRNSAVKNASDIPAVSFCLCLCLSLSLSLSLCALSPPLPPSSSASFFLFFSFPFAVPNLQKFVSDFLGGKLKNFIKSEAVPDNSNNDVTVVVGETFNDIVM